MDPRLYSVEPFPSYEDAPPNPHSLPSSFQSLVSIPHRDSSEYYSGSGKRRRPALQHRLSDAVRLRYYQYEVTFGLYMLDPGERVVVNVFFLAVSILLCWALTYSLWPFSIKMFCRSTYYLTGTLAGQERLCRTAIRLQPSTTASLEQLVGWTANSTTSSVLSIFRQ